MKISSAPKIVLFTLYIDFKQLVFFVEVPKFALTHSN